MSEASTSAASISTETAPPAAASTSKAPRRPRPPPAAPLPRTVVREGDNVLLRLPSKVIKPIKVNKTANVSLGKYGSFKAKELIGRPYGDTFEVVDSGLRVVQHTLNEIEETEANNENIKSTGAQKLTFEDIEALKNEGMTGREIIQKQVEEHSAFDLKTNYSKEKYLKRKEAKYLHMFTLIEPTVHEIALYNFDKQQSKTRDLRPDTLSQLMTLSNVRPGARVLVVEDVHGLIVAACVERMGGEGTILVINDFDSPPDLHLADSFNFNPEELSVVSSINWAATEEGYVPPDLPLELPPPSSEPSTSTTPQPPAPTSTSTNGDSTLTPELLALQEKRRNTREVAKLKKRKATFDKAAEARDDFFAGNFDSVIIACEYEPFSVLERLLPSIAGSAPIVVYSPHLQVLQDLHTKLRAVPEFLAPTVIEPWLRRYQVLPGRYHPEMNGMAHGGFILSCTRVIDDADAHSVMSGRRRRKRVKREQEELAAAAAEVEVEAAGAGTEGDGADVEMDEEKSSTVVE